MNFCRCDARLYVVFVDELDNPSTSAPDEATFELLEDLFGAISLEKPKVDLIPILALASAVGCIRYVFRLSFCVTFIYTPYLCVEDPST